MASSEAGSAEIYFAKKLANNEKKVREGALKRLKLWLNSRYRSGNDFQENDMLKLWKGLFYCMWFSDKPLIQEEVALNMAKLLHCFDDFDTAMVFLESFYTVIGKEWMGIDRLRLDKFYMLIRRFVQEAFQLLKKQSFSSKSTESFAKVVLNGPASSEDGKYPDGIKMFIAEIILEELKKVLEINETATDSVVIDLLKPFLSVVAFTESPAVFRTFKNSICEPLMTLASETPSETPSETEAHVKVQHEHLKDVIFNFATDRKTRGKSRKYLYALLQRLKEKETSQQLDVNGNVAAALDANAEMEVEHVDGTKKRKKKKKRKAKDQSCKIQDAEEVTLEDTCGKIDPEQEPLKKRKKKTEQEGNVGVDSDETIAINGLEVQTEAIAVEKEAEVYSESNEKKKKKKKNKKKAQCLQNELETTEEKDMEVITLQDKKVRDHDVETTASNDMVQDDASSLVATTVVLEDSVSSSCQEKVELENMTSTGKESRKRKKKKKVKTVADQEDVLQVDDLKTGTFANEENCDDENECKKKKKAEPVSDTDATKEVNGTTDDTSQIMLVDASEAIDNASEETSNVGGSSVDDIELVVPNKVVQDHSTEKITYKTDNTPDDTEVDSALTATTAATPVNDENSVVTKAVEDSNTVVPVSDLILTESTEKNDGISTTEVKTSRKKKKGTKKKSLAKDELSVSQHTDDTHKEGRTKEGACEEKAINIESIVAEETREMAPNEEAKSGESNINEADSKETENEGTIEKATSDSDLMSNISSVLSRISQASTAKAFEGDVAQVNSDVGPEETASCCDEIISKDAGEIQVLSNGDGGNEYNADQPLSTVSVTEEILEPAKEEVKEIPQIFKGQDIKVHSRADNANENESTQKPQAEVVQSDDVNKELNEKLTAVESATDTPGAEEKYLSGPEITLDPVRKTLSFDVADVKTDFETPDVGENEKGPIAIRRSKRNASRKKKVQDSKPKEVVKSTEKKVIFQLAKNKVQDISTLKVSPVIPFEPDQKPIKSALKKPPISRLKASDFF